MQNHSAGHTESQCAGRRRNLCPPRASSLAGLALLLALFCVPTPQFLNAQAQSSESKPPLPEAPQPRTPAQQAANPAAPCNAAGGAQPAAGQTGASPSPAATPPETAARQSTQPAPPPCPPAPEINWYARFLNGPEVRVLSPAEKARLAARNIIDPFNAVTILGTSAISVAADSHSAYGPGMSGFGRYVGVSYAQDVTGEFFGTFLIPSIVHQDPHYHRMPSASIPRRFRHAVVQIFWTKADDGSNMLNYANIVGFAIDGAISNAYVPGQDISFSASATRYTLGLATAPAENLITEFLPDLARRIHVRVVIIQRIINQAARTESAQ